MNYSTSDGRTDFPDDTPHIPGEKLPVTYFVIAPDCPIADQLRGDFSGELLNDLPRGYAIPRELGKKFDRNEERRLGHRLSIDGPGDIVIEGISELAWKTILRLLRETDPDHVSLDPNEEVPVSETPVKYSPMPDFLPVLRNLAWLVEDTSGKRQ